jgi:transcriptional regulator with XRE-family HTH domain
MNIAERLRSIREDKGLSQGDVERRSGLSRCYISRVEHGNTTPSVETLERFARAFDMKLYQLLYDGSEPPKSEPVGNFDGGKGGATKGKNARFLAKLRCHLAQMNERDRTVMMATVSQMAQRPRNASKGRL